MNQDPYVLEDLFIRLQGTQIVTYSFSQKILRLQIKTPVAAHLLMGSDTINLVLHGCDELYYLSFKKNLNQRIAQKDPEQFFRMGLQIQGLQLQNRNTNEENHNNRFVIYCNSYLQNIEAGELHFSANGFQLYDQEFGVIKYDDFKKAANALQMDQ